MRQSHYDVSSVLEPGQTECLIDGSSRQQISVILSNPAADPEDPPARRRPPAAVTLRPGEARELAWSLLKLADQADRMGHR